MTVRQVPMLGADMSMVLPGTWANIPVADEEAAKRGVSALVKRQVGRDDRMARVRREAREQLSDVVARSRAGGAFQVAISLEILPGVPFPAAMIMSWQQWRGETPMLSEQRSRLLGMLAGGEVLDLDPGLTVRTWRQVDITPGTETMPDTKLEYLMVTPATDALLHILVDAPVECEPEMIVALFDSMVDSIRWVAPNAVVADVL